MLATFLTNMRATGLIDVSVCSLFKTLFATFIKVSQMNSIYLLFILIQLGYGTKRSRCWVAGTTWAQKVKFPSKFRKPSGQTLSGWMPETSMGNSEYILIHLDSFPVLFFFGSEARSFYPGFRDSQERAGRLFSNRKLSRSFQKLQIIHRPIFPSVCCS